MKRLLVSPLLALVFAFLVACPVATLAADEGGAAAGAAKTDDKKTEEKKAEEPPPAPTADKGDTAWMLTSSALVMFMIPGLALFYAGMVRRKNVLATMMQSMVALAIVGVYWIAIGYSLAFGPSVLGTKESSYLGWSWDLFFLQGIAADKVLPGTGMTVYAHVMFQGMFAIITPALISGALAERIKFSTYCLFLILWVTLVYCPLAHWVWALDWWVPLDPAAPGTKAIGWLGAMGALDFAGGTVVHIAAGFSALAAILVLRKRFGYGHTAMHPNSMVLTLTGAGLLWFGWFGFNGGSASGSGALATSAFAATQAAAAAAGLSWMLIEWLHRGKPTALGLASGIVAGLVAVTPASGFVYIWGGLAIGLIAGLVCYVAVALKPKLGYDDSLDAFGVHGVGGFLGAVLTGVFCYKAVNSLGTDGTIAALTGGAGSPTSQVIVQLIAAGVAAGVALVATLVLVKVLDLVFGFTTSEKSETDGLDRTEHGEVGFDFGPDVATVALAEPRPASTPPLVGAKRYSLTVDGVNNGDLIHAWSALCQPGSTPPPAEFKAIYPQVTTVQGNKFRFRGGDPEALRGQLERLLRDRMRNANLRVRVEA